MFSTDWIPAGNSGQHVENLYHRHLLVTITQMSIFFQLKKQAECQLKSCMSSETIRLIWHPVYPAVIRRCDKKVTRRTFEALIHR